MKILLSNIADIRTGYQFRGRIPVYELGTVGVIQGKDVRSDHTIDPGSIVRIKDDGSFDRFYVQKNDVLLMNRGTRNYATLLDAALPRTITLSSFLTLRPHPDRVNPRYLFWALNDAYTQDKLAALARGTNIPNLTRTAVATLELPLPSLSEQAVIANLADTLANEEMLTRDLFNARRRELSLRVFGIVRREKTHLVADE